MKVFLYLFSLLNIVDCAMGGDSTSSSSSVNFNTCLSSESESEDERVYFSIFHKPSNLLTKNKEPKERKKTFVISSRYLYDPRDPIKFLEENVFMEKILSYIKSRFKGGSYICDQVDDMILPRLRQIYKHFKTKRCGKDEMMIFLANGFHNTSYLKIFFNDTLLSEQVAKEKRFEKSRGLLQITGKCNYKIANNYKGNIDFLKYPQKMAYLSHDSVSATLYFWDNLIENIEIYGGSVTYESVLKELAPQEYTSCHKTESHHARLFNRRKIYEELLSLFDL